MSIYCQQSLVLELVYEKFLTRIPDSYKKKNIFTIVISTYKNQKSTPIKFKQSTLLITFL